MNRYKKLIIEVKKFPESQEVMDNNNWFPIGDYGDDMIIGDSAYARAMEDDEYILTEKTTADEHNKNFISESEESEVGSQFISNRDPGDENTNRRITNRRRIVLDCEGGRRVANRRVA